jgi:hypothetical protein
VIRNALVGAVAGAMFVAAHLTGYRQGMSTHADTPQPEAARALCPEGWYAESGPGDGITTCYRVPPDYARPPPGYRPHPEWTQGWEKPEPIDPYDALGLVRPAAHPTPRAPAPLT